MRIVNLKTPGKRMPDVVPRGSTAPCHAGNVVALGPSDDDKGNDSDRKSSFSRLTRRLASRAAPARNPNAIPPPVSTITKYSVSRRPSGAAGACSSNGSATKRCRKWSRSIHSASGRRGSGASIRGLRSGSSRALTTGAGKGKGSARCRGLRSVGGACRSGCSCGCCRRQGCSCREYVRCVNRGRRCSSGLCSRPGEGR